MGLKAKLEKIFEEKYLSLPARAKWTHFVSERFFLFISEEVPEDLEDTVTFKDLASSRLLKCPCYICLNREIAERIVILGFVV